MAEDWLRTVATRLRIIVTSGGMYVPSRAGVMI